MYFFQPDCHPVRDGLEEFCNKTTQEAALGCLCKEDNGTVPEATVTVHIDKSGVISYNVRTKRCNGSDYSRVHVNSGEDEVTRRVATVLFTRNQTVFMIHSYNKINSQHSFQIFQEELVKPPPNNMSQIAKFFRERRIRRYMESISSKQERVINSLKKKLGRTEEKREDVEAQRNSTHPIEDASRNEGGNPYDDLDNSNS